MRPELGALRRATEAYRDEGFDRFMAGCVRAMLVSRGFSGEQLEEAMTMGRVMTAFQRGLEEMVSRGRALGARGERDVLIPLARKEAAHHKAADSRRWPPPNGSRTKWSRSQRSPAVTSKPDRNRWPASVISR